MLQCTTAVLTIREIQLTEEEEEALRPKADNGLNVKMSLSGRLQGLDLFGKSAKQAAMEEELAAIRQAAIQREEEEAEAEEARLKAEKEAYEYERQLLADELQRKEEEAAKALLAKCNFHLQEELTKINCGVFFEAFASLGYNDEGAFSTLTDEDLKTRMNVPRAARLRIAALIDAVRRRIEVIAHQKGITVAEQIEKKMLQESAMGTLALDTGEEGGGGEISKGIAEVTGLELDEEDEAVQEAADGYFVKKADVNRAWAKKAKLLNKKKKDLKQFDPLAVVDKAKKKHSAEVQRKIDEIRRRCILDEFATPADEDFLLAQYRNISNNPHWAKWDGGKMGGFPVSSIGIYTAFFVVVFLISVVLCCVVCKSTVFTMYQLCY